MKHSNKQIIFSILKPCAVVFMSLGLVNCGSNGNAGFSGNSSGFQQNHGPFDKNGNYIESWADNPPAQNRNWKPSKPELPNSSQAIAKNNLPKPPPRPIIAAPRPAPAPIVSYAPPRPAPKTSYTAPRPAPKTAYTPPKKAIPPVVAKSSPAKKITPKKITPKTKPPVIHVVKKGDTLYELSLKYGASVASIQKANGLRNANIAIGKRLTIPRK